MGTYTRRKAGGVFLAIALAALLVAPPAAIAASFSVTLEKEIVRGAEGERFDLGTFSVPAELVGQSCTVTASGNNNESVHPGNDVEVYSQNSVVLAGVEDSKNKTTVAGGLLTLDESVSFVLVLGPDGVYSAELDVVFECQPQETTTTTTEPETTTTTEPETTTSTSTTTTEPEVGATTTTTEPEPTTTTIQVASTTTSLVTTTTGNTPETLPFTGVDSDDLALVAYIALAAGVALVLLTRTGLQDR